MGLFCFFDRKKEIKEGRSHAVLRFKIPHFLPFFFPCKNGKGRMKKE
jgi:hypothetical protein